MAKTKTRYRTRTVTKRVRSAASGGKGKLMKAGYGLLGGLGARVGANFHPLGGPVGMGAVGYFTNNDTLLTLAGVSAAGMIPLGSLGGSGSGSGSGWY